MDDEQTINDTSSVSDESPDTSLDVVNQEDGDATATQSGNGEVEQTASDDPPFHEHKRWKEVQAERDQLKRQVDDYRAYDTFIQRAKTDGYNSGDDILRAIQQQAEASRFAQSQAELQKQYESGDITDSEKNAREYALRAEAQANAAQAQAAQAQQMVEQAQWQQYELQVDHTIAQLQSKYPHADMAEVKTLHYARVGDLESIAKNQHDRQVAKINTAIAKYNSTKQAQKLSPSAEGSGGTSTAKPAIPTDDKEFLKWFDAQAKATDRARS